MTFKSTAAIAIVGALASLAVYNSNIPTGTSLTHRFDLNELNPEFLDLLRLYNKQYLSASELRKRVGIFMKRDLFIHQQRLENNSA
jgi:hypothetical protein